MKVLPNVIDFAKLYILGDFNINYQNQNLTGCKSNTLVSATVCNNFNIYFQFCAMFGVTQIIKSPIHITF